jgi:hypothetical protein
VEETLERQRTARDAEGRGAEGCRGELSTQRRALGEGKRAGDRVRALQLTSVTGSSRRSWCGPLAQPRTGITCCQPSLAQSRTNLAARATPRQTLRAPAAGPITMLHSTQKQAQVLTASSRSLTHTQSERAAPPPLPISPTPT